MMATILKIMLIWRRLSKFVINFKNRVQKAFTILFLVDDEEGRGGEGRGEEGRGGAGRGGREGRGGEGDPHLQHGPVCRPLYILRRVLTVYLHPQTSILKPYSS